MTSGENVSMKESMYVVDFYSVGLNGAGSTVVVQRILRAKLDLQGKF